MWSPRTLEDFLLAEHFKTHPGTAYLELKVGLSGKRYLVEHALEPSEITMNVVCTEGNLDLEQFSRDNGIDVHLYPIDDKPPVGPNDPRVDVRRSPDEPRHRAFLAGWTDAARGRLYGSILRRKTHANMGNLFGWIYGDMSIEFRLETWARYEQAFARREDEEAVD